jgi:hypothetical protein
LHYLRCHRDLNSDEYSTERSRELARTLNLPVGEVVSMLDLVESVLMARAERELLDGA